jgi:hypothetical protein
MFIFLAPSLVDHALAPRHGGSSPHVFIAAGVGKKGLIGVGVAGKDIPTEALLPIELALEGMGICHSLGLAIRGKGQAIGSISWVH